MLSFVHGRCAAVVGQRQPVVNGSYASVGALGVRWPMNRYVWIHAWRNPKLSVDDFFLVTKPESFAKLRSANFNVVLQSDRPVDDGSLSVRCQVEGRSYVNVEALFDNGVEQLRMLRALAD